MSVTRARIRKELDRVKAMVERAWKRHEKDPRHGDEPFVCPRIGTIGRCTDSASYLAHRLGGRVYGYAIEDNPTAEVGADEGGHDFVVVDGRWLVDFWAWDTYQLPDLYDMKNPEEHAAVLKGYGDPEKWTRMSDENFEYFKKYVNEMAEG